MAVNSIPGWNSCWATYVVGSEIVIGSDGHPVTSVTGSLPTGVTFPGSYGATSLSGITTTLGVFEGEINGIGFRFWVVPDGDTIGMTPESLTPTMVQGSPSAVSFAGTRVGSAPATPYQFSVIPPMWDDLNPDPGWAWGLPDGTSLALDGVISGTPADAISAMEPDNQGVLIQVVDADGRANRYLLPVVVNAAGPPDGDEPPAPRIPIMIRRERTFPHMSSEQFKLFYSYLELLIEKGVGLPAGQGADPQIMLQWSNDGGRTWGQERWISAGKLGEYRTRCRWLRLGSARDRVFRVVVTDPVSWAFIDAYVGVTKGTS